MNLELNRKKVDELSEVATIKYNMYDKKQREERGEMVFKLGTEGFKHVTTIEQDYWKIDVMQKVTEEKKTDRKQVDELQDSEHGTTLFDFETLPFEPGKEDDESEPKQIPEWFHVDMMVNVKDIALFYGVSQSKVNSLIETLGFETYKGSGKYNRRFRSIGGTDQDRLKEIHDNI
ncbi:hypothetical protein [Bacillus sp. COPE52]|uniref:hypothetical protein n=1 Tax=Bacillus sp. COPE52 TaxID=2233998 RepID=UPI000E1019D6|nr:hypothetical protein [Bacillus sp. COPE52]AXK19149.1 hypothetical protein DPQ31_16195 [Bacillus sp. COPE52]